MLQPKVRRARKRVKRYVVYLLARAAAAFFTWLPLRTALAFGAWMGRVAYLVDGPDRRRAIAQLQEALALDPPAARQLAKRMFENLGRTAIEIAVLPRIRRGFESYVEFPTEARRTIERVMSRGKGVLFISGHLGSWELLAQRIAHEGFDAATFAKKSSNPYLGEWLVARRSAGRLETINRGDRSAPRQMIAAIRRGAILGALIDQDTRVDSVHVPFFGKPAATPVAPAAIAVRSSLPVIVGFIERKSDFGHTIRIEEVAIPSDAAEATALLTHKIEEQIRRRPEEWVWFHARWKTPAPDA